MRGTIKLQIKAGSPSVERNVQGAFEMLVSQFLSKWFDDLQCARTSSDDGSTLTTLPPDLAPYVYSPLPTPTSIRLLHLHPGGSAIPLNCTISVVDLRDNPTYTALSYSWKRDVNWFNKDKVQAATVPSGIYLGRHRTVADFLSSRREETRPVLCNERHRLDVLPNLHDALVQLRRTRPGLYWIDAICINQSDRQERAQQVQMMDRIYGEAPSVVVWLGAVPTPLMSSVKEISKEFVKHDGQAQHEEGQMQVGQTNRKDLLGAMRLAKKFAAVFFVLSRRWFQRVWVLQEVLLSRDLVFLCGEGEFASGQLEQMLSWILDPVRNSSIKTMLERIAEISGPQFGVRFGSIPPMLSSLAHFRAGGRWTMEQWLAACQGRKVTDQRDLVYAGLGVADAAGLKISQSIKEVEPPGPWTSEASPDEYEKLRSKPLWPVLAPDYTVSTEEALLNLAACLLSQPANITLLSYVGQSSEYIPSLAGMPRAALDLMTGTRPPTGPSWHYNPSSLVARTQVPFKTLGANFAACCSIPNSPRISANGKEISLLASTIDTVDRVWRWFAPARPEELLDMLLYLESSPSTYTMNNEPLLSAIAHASIADIWEKKCPSPDETTAAFLHALHDQVDETARELTDATKSAEQDAERRRLGLPVLSRHKAFLSLSPDARAAHLWQLFDSVKSNNNNILTPEDLSSSKAPLPAYRNVVNSIWRTCYTTSRGLIGAGPISLGAGDKIMLVPGTYTPYAFSTPAQMLKKDRDGAKSSLGGKRSAQMALKAFAWAGKSSGDGGLRPWKKGDVWKKKRQDGYVLLGEAYVRGWMSGVKSDGTTFERITIV